MQLISTILFFVVIWYLYKKRSTLTYRKGIKAILEGETGRGLDLLEKASKQGLTPSQEIQAAYAELKYGDPKKAKTKLNVVMMDQKAKEPVKLKAKCMMAIIHLKNGELRDARETLDELHEKNYAESNFYATYGYVALLTREQDYYTRVNEEAYAYNPENPVILDNYGLCLYMNGDFEKAKQEYERLMEKEPKFPEAYYNYACVLKKLDEISLAKEMLTKALDMEFSGVTTIAREQVEAMLASLNEN